MESRPLDQALSRYGQLVLTPIFRSRSVDELDSLESDLDDEIAAIRPQLPQLGAGGPGSYEEAHHFGKRREDGSASGA